MTECAQLIPTVIEFPPWDSVNPPKRSASAFGPGDAGHSLNEAVALFADARPRLVGIALRVLGSWSDAEDIVQEVWVRWQRYDRRAVRNAPAFLAVTTTRLAINAIQSAKARNETCAGPWLSESMDALANPTHGAERDDTVESAIQLLLERLSPTELAAYILREAFDYPYPRIAEIIGQREANTRQIVSRARKNLVSQRRRQVSTDEHHCLVAAFFRAARTGDLTQLEELLCDGRYRLHRRRDIQPVRRPGGTRQHRQNSFRLGRTGNPRMHPGSSQPANAAPDAWPVLSNIRQPPAPEEAMPVWRGGAKGGS